MANNSNRTISYLLLASFVFFILCTAGLAINHHINEEPIGWWSTFCAIASCIFFIAFLIHFLSHLPLHEVSTIAPTANVGDSTTNVSDQRIKIIEAREEARKTIIQIIGGIAIIGVLGSLYFQIKDVELSEKRLLDERFYSAAKLLGEMAGAERNLEARISAIETLSNLGKSKIAKESYHNVIEKIFYSYLIINGKREDKDWKKCKPGEKIIIDNNNCPNLEVDLQQTLLVLGKYNSADFKRNEEYLSLKGAFLRNGFIGSPDKTTSKMNKEDLKAKGFFTCDTAKATAKKPETKEYPSNYFGLIMSDVDLSLSRIRNARFEDIRAVGIKFNNAKISNSAFLDIALDGAEFKYATLNNVSISGKKKPDSDAAGVNFSYATISGGSMKDIAVASFKEAKLQNVGLSGAIDIKKSNFSGACLVAEKNKNGEQGDKSKDQYVIDLSNLDLTNAAFTGVKFRTTLEACDKEAETDKIIIINFDNSKLEKMNLDLTNHSNVKIRNAHIPGATSAGCDNKCLKFANEDQYYFKESKNCSKTGKVYHKGTEISENIETCPNKQQRL